jgi:hypothetical protein
MTHFNLNNPVDVICKNGMDLVNGQLQKVPDDPLISIIHHTHVHYSSSFN